MQYKSTLKILGLGMDSGKPTNCKTWTTMLFITSAGQSYHAQKMLGCGMLWEAATKKSLNLLKHRNAINEQNYRKIAKE